MTAEDPKLLRLVRLIITTDWDAGFQLTPNVEPLLDVPPGGECLVECFPDRSVAIRDVIVREFQLVQISSGFQVENVAPLARGSKLPRAYRLQNTITVQASERIVARLRNDGPAPIKQKVATLVRESFASASADPGPTGRAEDAVECTACGKRAGDSCDGPGSHPSRLALFHARAVQRLPARDEQDLAARFPTGNLPAGEVPHYATSRCPTCESTARDELGAFCHDAWHNGPIVHVPKIARTARSGPGNVALIRGCSCGASITTVSGFADHINVPHDMMRSMLAIVGIAFDLIDHPKQMDGRDARRQIERCLEFKR
jgi:hypothetical protein